MFKHFNTMLAQQSRLKIIILGLAGTMLVGVADYCTGYELSFSVFYLIPVAVVVWFSSYWLGVVMCIISAVIWLVIDMKSGQVYSNDLILYWNAAVRLIFFLATSYLLAEVKLRLEREAMLARTDGLTQLLNLRAFRDISSVLMRLAERHQHSAVLAYIDLDNFKTINDTHGHHEGDRVLQHVANILAESVRSTDVVARIGGDEFAIFMPEMEKEEVEHAFSQIREMLLREAAVMGWPIGYSIGVAVFQCPPADINDALKIADRLMYRVKGTGKNNILFENYDATLVRTMSKAG